MENEAKVHMLIVPRALGQLDSYNLAETFDRPLPVAVQDQDVENRTEFHHLVLRSW